MKTDYLKGILYLLIVAGNAAQAVTTWDWKACVSLVVAIAAAWKMYLANPQVAEK